jgi:hypothetical protein
VGFFAIFICLYIKYKEKKSKNQIYGEIFFQTKLTLRCPCHTSKNPDKIDLKMSPSYIQKIKSFLGKLNYLF